MHTYMIIDNFQLHISSACVELLLNFKVALSSTLSEYYAADFMKLYGEIFIFKLHNFYALHIFQITCRIFEVLYY